MERFNPRARVGRDALAAMTVYPSQSFNPRARVGRDILGRAGGSVRSEFQSTRPRGARPSNHDGCIEAGKVSIHAPAWGATQHNRGAIRFSSVSIHAPAWGATQIILLR